MLADHLSTETVKRADSRLLEEGQLLRDSGVLRAVMLLAFESLADAAAHFGGSGFCKGDHQYLIEIGLALQDLLNATFHEGAGLAGASSRDEQDASIGTNGRGLLWREGTELCAALLDHALTSFLRLRNGCVQGSIRQIEAW